MDPSEPHFLLTAPYSHLRHPPTLPTMPGVAQWSSASLVQQPDAADLLFGYQIPSLPDFLSDPALLSASEAERLAQTLVRWAGLVANLWKWSHCAFSLRYQTRPAEGAIDIALLSRVTAGSAQRHVAGKALAADLAQLFAGLRVPLEAIAGAEALQGWLSPFQLPAVVELRQAEELVALRVGRAYTVFPFWGAAGDWLHLCETLVRQPSPVALSVHLEPTALTAEEQSMLGSAASLAHQAADFTYPGQYFQNVRIVDPQAAMIGRIYAAATKRLARPFLLTVQVVSPDQVAAASVAQALGVAATTAPERPIMDEERDIPSRSAQLMPRSQEELRSAMQTFSALHLTAWGATDAAPGQERLRFLTNARGAGAAFRLPIAMRGGVPGIVTRQIAPGFNSGLRKRSLDADEILLGTLDDGGLVAIKRGELVRHALIAGFTRSGKTNSCLSVLDQLWRVQGIPFLALEPVKTEYRGLLKQPGFEQLLVFTLGDEAVAPFRLNPFELLPGIRVQAHIGALRACFDAALPQFGVLPMLVEEGIHAVYERLGWRLTDRSDDHPNRPFPTLRDLYAILESLVENYTGEVKQNLQTALTKRIGSLLRGSKGRMFSTQRGIPIDHLMGRPVVLELDRLSLDEQPLAMMFVLMFMREHAKGRRSRQLQHVTLVEEAHLVMANVAPVGNPELSANVQAEGSQAFERLLAEIGGLGEGVIVAEQSPSKLVAGAINNTSLKIAHQLIGPREVESVGGAMILDDLQRQQVQRLRVGQAAIFMSGFEKATFMVAPSYKQKVGFDDHLPDDDVAHHMSAYYADDPDRALPYQGCEFCTSRCRYRSTIEHILSDVELHRRFYEVAKRLDATDATTADSVRDQIWGAFAAVALDAAAEAGHAGAVDAAWCYWVHRVDEAYTFRGAQRRRFIEAVGRQQP